MQALHSEFFLVNILHKVLIGALYSIHILLLILQLGLILLQKLIMRPPRLLLALPLAVELRVRSLVMLDFGVDVQLDVGGADYISNPLTRNKYDVFL